MFTLLSISAILALDCHNSSLKRSGLGCDGLFPISGTFFFRQVNQRSNIFLPVKQLFLLVLGYTWYNKPVCPYFQSLSKPPKFFSCEEKSLYDFTASGLQHHRYVHSSYKLGSNIFSTQINNVLVLSLFYALAFYLLFTC